MDLIKRGEPTAEGVVDCLFERREGHDATEVEKCARRAGDGDAVPNRHIRGRQVHRPMDSGDRVACAAALWNEDVDPSGPHAGVFPDDG